MVLGVGKRLKSVLRLKILISAMIDLIQDIVHVYPLLTRFCGAVCMSNTSVVTVLINGHLERQHRSQWTYGPTLLPWFDHFHTSLACFTAL